MMNIMIYYTQHPAAKVGEADAAMKAIEQDNRRARVRHTHCDDPVRQASGLPRAIYVLPGHSRQSRYPLMAAALREARTLQLHQHTRLGGIYQANIADLIQDLDAESEGVDGVEVQQ